MTNLPQSAKDATDVLEQLEQFTRRIAGNLLEELQPQQQTTATPLARSGSQEQDGGRTI